MASWHLGREEVETEIGNGRNLFALNKGGIKKTKWKSLMEFSMKERCMHFIPSGPRSSLHLFDYIHYKNLQHNFPKMRGGGVQRPFGTFPKINPFWRGSASLS